MRWVVESSHHHCWLLRLDTFQQRHHLLLDSVLVEDLAVARLGLGFFGSADPIEVILDCSVSAWRPAAKRLQGLEPSNLDAHAARLSKDVRHNREELVLDRGEVEHG